MLESWYLVRANVGYSSLSDTSYKLQNWNRGRNDGCGQFSRAEDVQKANWE